MKHPVVLAFCALVFVIPFIGAISSIFIDGYSEPASAIFIISSTIFAAFLIGYPIEHLQKNLPEGDARFPTLARALGKGILVFVGVGVIGWIFNI